MEVWSDELCRINAATLLQKLRREAGEQQEQEATGRAARSQTKADEQPRLF